MERSEMLQKVREIFLSVFDEDVSLITENTSSKDIEDWDSITHITLLTKVEKDFDVKFSMQDIINMDDVGEMLTIIENKKKDEERAILCGIKNNKYKNKHISKLFEETAERFSDKIAVKANNSQITYGELKKQINNLANKLNNAGISKSDRIAVCTSRNIETIVAIYAILRVGAVYVPIEESIAKERMNYIFEDSNVEMVLLTSSNQNIESNIRKLKVEIDKRNDVKCNVDYPDTTIPSYIIYTSGTTGYPKGVLINNDWVLNLCEWNKNEMAINQNSKVIMLFSFVFDASIKNIFTPLLTGAELILGPTILFDTYKILQIISENKVTHCNTSPELFYAMLDEAKKDSFNAFKSLTHVMLGGEALDAKLLVPWLENDLDFIIFNSYGPTECTSITSCHNVKKSEVINEDSIPIGRPIDNKNIYLINNKNSLCKFGEIGELCVGGVGVISKYINNENRDKEDIETYVHEINEHIYRTGDLAKVNEHGDLVFVGRKDRQVKIHGHRVELSEIESTISNNENIHRNICEYIKNEDKQYLVAFIVVENAFLWKEDKLIKELEGVLPTYMIPTDIIQINEIPLNRNGKVDRKKLNRLFFENKELANKSVKQKNEKYDEKDRNLCMIKDIWKELLRVKDVGINDNFFDVGGYSLLLNKLRRKILNNLNVSVSILDLMNHPTIRSCAEFISSDGKDDVKSNTDLKKDVSENFKKRMQMIKRIKSKRLNAIKKSGEISGQQVVKKE